MNCQLCDRRTFYYGKFAPCPDCKVTKSAATKKQEKPYWTEILK